MLKRVYQPNNPTMDHEDDEKSQTIDQFLRTMDNEIIRLQDTENVYNKGE